MCDANAHVLIPKTDIEEKYVVIANITSKLQVVKNENTNEITVVIPFVWWLVQALMNLKEMLTLTMMMCGRIRKKTSQPQGVLEDDKEENQRKVITQTVGCYVKNKKRPCVTDLTNPKDHGVFEVYTGSKNGMEFMKQVEYDGIFCDDEIPIE